MSVESSLARSRSSGHAGGFTLVELLVTIVVLGLLLTLALPGMSDFLVGNRLSTNVNGFIGLVNYARSEAIVRNQDVVICPKNSTTIACVSQTGWNTLDIQAFVDENGNGDRDATEVLLKTIAAVDPGDAQTGFDSSAAASKVIFGSAGFARTALSFKIYAKSSDSAYQARFGRTVCVSKAGRVRVAAYTVTSCPDF
ncbi:GspH/FimT family pseudopilin [Variovorax guangxiensis]|uniref:GspH/FimT family pseudopilin n=1 Tax=Variovorax guangxiensis TaxID=1775474 RepID=UPI0028587528|nr:GspH/FimT family pseudopilin [Variovorax guangxiensis]MDR6854122.1 type IV fimbrial biogenesis protein FimT [Variovorax guangxiensis]